jgi:hypothetical protein
VSFSVTVARQVSQCLNRIRMTPSVQLIVTRSAAATESAAMVRGRFVIGLLPITRPLEQG